MADISKISPDNGTTIYNLKDIEARKRVPEVLLKDTVGWTGKNLGSNIIVTGNITNYGNALLIDADLEPNTPYIISFVSDSSSDKFYFNENLFTENTHFTTVVGLNSYTVTTVNTISKSEVSQWDDGGWRVLKNDKAYSSAPSITNVMLRKADISDSTYEPYHESVEEVVGDIRAEQAVLGAKNLLALNKLFSSGDIASISDNGKVIEVKNPSASVWSQFQVYIDVEPNREYRFTCDVLYTSGKGRVAISNEANTFTLVTSDTLTNDGNIDISFNSSSENRIIVKFACTLGDSEIGDITYNNSMLRFASDPDDTYVPYAMTNREITDELAIQESAFTTTQTLNENANYLVKIGKMVFADLSLKEVTESANVVLATIPQGYRPKYEARICTADGKPVNVKTNGDVTCASALTNAYFSIHTSWITS